MKHRFASHVCQTLFTVAADTIAREVRSSADFFQELSANLSQEKGILPPTTDFPNEGELRTLTEQIPAICEVLQLFASCR